MQVQEKLVKLKGSPGSSQPLKANMLPTCQDLSEAVYLLSSLAHSMSPNNVGTAMA